MGSRDWRGPFPIPGAASLHGFVDVQETTGEGRMWREFTVRAGLCSENGNRLRAFEDGVVESSKILASCAAAGVQRAMTGGAGVSPYAPTWRGQVVSASRKACANAWHRGFDWAKREMQAKNGGAS